MSVVHIKFHFNSAAVISSSKAKFKLDMLASCSDPSPKSVRMSRLASEKSVEVGLLTTCSLASLGAAKGRPADCH